MDSLNKLDEELEKMKDLYINMVKSATKKYEIDYDSCEDENLDKNQNEIEEN